ncbi:MAG: alginate export family protein [candidate division Zixibacteria bacterium]|nr:alginate export family protein [candidate division Zixibacteria bacterium]
MNRIYNLRLTKGSLSIIAACFLLIMALPDMAKSVELGEGIDFNAQMRWRGELDGRDFDNGTPLFETPLLRTRMGLSIAAIDNTRLFFQLQDSRNLGTNSSGLANDTNLGVHQAYIKLLKFLHEDMNLQLGRFQAFYGRQRLIGAVGWSNVGRVFDGIRASYKTDEFKVDLFSLKIVERGFRAIPDYRDWVLYGIYGTLMENQLDLFWLFDWDQANAGGDHALRRYTAGLYFNHFMDSGLKVEFDAAFQGGKAADMNIAAFMFAGDLTYEMDDIFQKVGFGFDITSGDEDPLDNDINTFNNLYYTGHKFRGYMDYFIGSPAEGLFNLVLRASLKPNDKFALLIDLHHFQTMKKYALGVDEESSQVGQEIDVTAKFPLEKGLGLQCGTSLFLASDDFIADSDPALWFYAMLTAGIK